MLNLNQLMSELLGFIGYIPPDAQSAGTAVTGWIDARKAERFLGVVMVGDMVSTSTVNAKIQQATDSSGTGAKDITGKAITALTEAGSDGDKLALINLEAAELDVNNGFCFIQMSITTAAAASEVAGLLISTGQKYGVGAAVNVAACDEVVV